MQLRGTTITPPQPPRVPQLRMPSSHETNVCGIRGISTAGFFDKDDFVRALIGSSPAAPSAPHHAPAASVTPAAASSLSTADPPRPFANMPVDDPDSQIQVNENPSLEAVTRGLNTLMAQPYIMIKVPAPVHACIFLAAIHALHSPPCFPPSHPSDAWKCSTS